MTTYVMKRLSLFVPTLFLVTVILFLLTRMVPGDPALLILLGDMGEGSYTQEELDNLRHELGTDRPLVVQYYTWVWDMGRGDFGLSMWYRDPVWNEIKDKFPTTLELTVLAFLISFGIPGIPGELLLFAGPLSLVLGISPEILSLFLTLYLGLQIGVPDSFRTGANTTNNYLYAIILNETYTERFMAPQEA